MTKLNRPHYFTPKEDLIIDNLFDWMSTQKLSILMQIKSESIVARQQYLTDERNKSSSLKPNKKQ
ncbi:hypothetical protein [Geminocystis sp. NIES-3709]|uniref:hypothetical protein n=1 Tax=Geminocystis sp. NIES-3709 TaxID=1617448 RepID=UPI0005FCBD5C|nr:hypothetical protein [Geminocystis sp. NIES-3709]BAQ65575.1 hypothetical protein GM3709_2340 [Geminocystis sp. NIES-3709]